MKNKLIHQLLFIGAIMLSIFFFFFIVMCSWISFDVKKQCTEAKQDYGKNLNCEKALAKKLDDEKNSYRERNSAIWALGQVGNSESLLVLKKYYTGIIPSREPLNKSISQYELKKAIKLCAGGANITKIFFPR